MPMDPGLKQRLVGAAVLVAVAVIFLPILIKAPAPDSEVSELSFKLPEAPVDEPRSINLPLSADAANADLLPEETATQQEERADSAEEDSSDRPDATGAAPAEPEPALPPTTANGKYVVHFASFATREDAEVTARGLQARELPAFTEAVSANGRAAVRVRIGPYLTQAEAEIVRIQAAQVRPDVQPRVFMLLDEGAAERTAAALEQSSPSPAPARTAASGVGFVVQLGAFSNAARANGLQERLRKAGIVAFTDTVNTSRGRLIRVNAGPVSSRREADQLKTKVKSAVEIEGVVRSHP